MLLLWNLILYVEDKSLLFKSIRLLVYKVSAAIKIAQTEVGARRRIDASVSPDVDYSFNKEWKASERTWRRLKSL